MRFSLLRAFTFLLVALTAPAAAQDSVAAEPDVARQDSASAWTCPAEGYCENVLRQVHRFFRPPPGTAGATGEVCFRIQRDGSVTDVQVQDVRNGGADFRLAMMEAVQNAGSRRAFGTLPGAFDPGRSRWCVELSPS